MTSPMQVLEDTPKVWVVWYMPPYEDGEANVASIHRTEEGAKKYISKQRDYIQEYLSIDWEVLND